MQSSRAAAGHRPFDWERVAARTREGKVVIADRGAHAQERAAGGDVARCSGIRGAERECPVPRAVTDADVPHIHRADRSATRAGLTVDAGKINIDVANLGLRGELD